MSECLVCGFSDSSPYVAVSVCESCLDNCVDNLRIRNEALAIEAERKRKAALSGY